MYLGEIIKNYRDEHGLSMQAFADSCGLSKGYIAMLERNVNSKTGEPVAPSFETFLKVSKAMKISVTELLQMVDENQPVTLSSHDEEMLSDYVKKSVQDEMILESYHSMNDDGKARLLAYAEELKIIYKK